MWLCRKGAWKRVGSDIRASLAGAQYRVEKVVVEETAGGEIGWRAAQVLRGEHQLAEGAVACHLCPVLLVVRVGSSLVGEGGKAEATRVLRGRRRVRKDAHGELGRGKGRRAKGQRGLGVGHLERLQVRRQGRKAPRGRQHRASRSPRHVRAIVMMMAARARHRQGCSRVRVDVGVRMAMPIQKAVGWRRNPHFAGQTRGRSKRVGETREQMR